MALASATSSDVWFEWDTGFAKMTLSNAYLSLDEEGARTRQGQPRLLYERKR